MRLFSKLLITTILASARHDTARATEPGILPRDFSRPRAADVIGAPELNTLIAERLPVYARYGDGTDLETMRLAHLKNIEDLREVTVSVGPVKDRDLARLERATQLETLELPEFSEGKPSDISDVGIRSISRLPNLQSLTIASTRIGDAGLAQLATLTKLTGLDLASPNLTDAGISQLRVLPELCCLRLRAPLVSDAGLALLAKRPRLWWLNVRGTRATGTCFRPGAGAWQRLHMVECNFTDDGLDAVSRLQSDLTILHIVGPGTTNAGLAHLPRLKSLRSIILRHTRVTEDGLTRLIRDCPHLDFVHKTNEP